MYFSDFFFMPLDKIREEDLVQADRCGCCGAKGSFVKLEIFQQKPEISFIRCRRCGAVTYDRILKPEKLDEVYEAYSYLNNDRKNTKQDQITFHGRDRFGKHLVKMLRGFPKKDCIRILDFGGGDGALCYALAEQLLKKGYCRKADITVADYNTEPFQTKIPQIRLRHCFPLDAVKDKNFDIVIASAVLEHLPRPGRELRMLVEMTTPGGVLYFRTPWKYPLYHFLKRLGIILDMRYPRHIWDLGADWWKRIPSCLGIDSQLNCLKAQPSIVEKTLRDHFAMALGANLLKAPGYVFTGWRFVGGWEILLKKRKSSLDR